MPGANGTHPLHQAATNGNVNVLQFLLDDCGLDVETTACVCLPFDDATMATGVTALWAAACWGHVAVVRYLYTQHGASLTATSDNGVTPLLIAQRTSCPPSSPHVVNYIYYLLRTPSDPLYTAPYLRSLPQFPTADYESSGDEGRYPSSSIDRTPMNERAVNAGVHSQLRSVPEVPARGSMEREALGEDACLSLATERRKAQVHNRQIVARAEARGRGKVMGGSHYTPHSYIV
jgi:hypothetical protein